MNPCPQVIGNATVLLHTLIDYRQRPTGKTTHIVGGTTLGTAAGLAICNADGGFYLFYCDPEWDVITDTWHQTVEDAKDQAEFEFEGVSGTWEKPVGE